MKVVSVINQKGGVGKSTIAINIADALREQGYRVLLVDSDPQASATDWSDVVDNNPLDVLVAPNTQNLRKIDNYLLGYEIVVIDGAAHLQELTTVAISKSDVVLIPVQPSAFDIWASSELVKNIQAWLTAHQEDKKAAFIVNRAVSGTRLGREIIEALKEADLPMLRTVVHQRQSLAQTIAEGKTIQQSNDGKAKADINGLVDDVKKLAGIT